MPLPNGYGDDAWLYGEIVGDPISDLANLSEQPESGRFQEAFDGALLAIEVNRISANRDAGNAAIDWLMALGLVREIEEIRQTEAVIPAPGLNRWLHEAELASNAAHAAADRAAMVSGAISIEAIGELGPVSDASAAVALDCRSVIGVALRQIAQIGLGVGSFTDGDDQVLRLERACTEILFVAPDDSERFDLADDGPTLDGPTQSDAEVQLAGMLCRLILNRQVVLTIDTAQGQMNITRASDGGLLARFEPDGEFSGASLDGQGWSRHGAVWVQSWEDPVRIAVPATTVLRLLVEAGVDIADFVVSASC